MLEYFQTCIRTKDVPFPFLIEIIYLKMNFTQTLCTSSLFDSKILQIFQGAELPGKMSFLRFNWCHISNKSIFLRIFSKFICRWQCIFKHLLDCISSENISEAKITFVQIVRPCKCSNVHCHRQMMWPKVFKLFFYLSFNNH